MATPSLTTEVTIPPLSVALVESDDAPGRRMEWPPLVLVTCQTRPPMSVMSTTFADG